MDTGVGISQVLLSFLLVMGLIGLFALALKKFALPMGMMQKMRKDARIQLLDICLIDPRHKVALFSCDGREYLVILSQDAHTVVETGKESP